ncbi:MAG: hypothetical protein K2Y37_22070 [Pirellulales bacterium]|nr:hypothetical protein [Pirellulales bacterium]
MAWNFGRRGLIVCGLVCFSLAPATALAGFITIDDFSTPSEAEAYVIGMSNANPTIFTHTGAGILNGAQRELRVEVKTSPVSPVDAVGVLGAGEYNFGSLNSSGVEAKLTYSGPGGSSLGGIDLTGGGTNDKFDLRLGTDKPVVIRINAYGPSGSATVTVPNVYSSFGGTEDTFAFYKFSTTGTFSFSQVDKLEFIFSPGGTDRGIDFEIAAIKAVPEPATALMAGFAVMAVVVAMMVRRRRSAP